MASCSAFGGSSPGQTTASQDAVASGSAGSAANYMFGSDESSFSTGIHLAADSVKLINIYLDKQSRVKCGHKKGDPNHVEAA